MKHFSLIKILATFSFQWLLLNAGAVMAQADSENNCLQTSYQGKAKVPERLVATMSRISKAYCETNGKQTILVTSGVRTPEHQAKLMQSCLRQRGCGYYANAEAATELQATYDAAEPNQKIEAVAMTIKAQMSRSEPCYISKHLTEFGLDLERWQNGHSNHCKSDLLGDDLLLSQVLNISEDVANVIYKEASGCTHFHVNFVGWDQIPGLKTCSKPATGN